MSPSFLLLVPGAPAEVNYDTRPHPEWCTMFTGDGGCSEHDSDSQGFIPATADMFAQRAGTAVFPAVDVHGFWHTSGLHPEGPAVSLELNWPVPDEPHNLHPGQITEQVDLTPEVATKVAAALRHGEPLTADAYDGVSRSHGLAVTVDPGDDITAVRFGFDEPMTMLFRTDEAAGLADVIDEAVNLVTGSFRWLVPAEVFGGQAVAA